MAVSMEHSLQVCSSPKGRSASFSMSPVGGASVTSPDLTSDDPMVTGRGVSSAAARRSQSCRVQGSRPRVRRRQVALELEDAVQAGSTSSLCVPPGGPHRDSPRGSRSGGRPPSRDSLTPRGRRGTPQELNDADAYRLRNFSLTAKGFVNRGDSFRVRRHSTHGGNDAEVRGPSTSPGAPAASEQLRPMTCATVPPAAAEKPAVMSYTVALLGSPGVGKTALIDQFLSSDCTNAYDSDSYGDTGHEAKAVSIELEGEESELRLIAISNPKCDLTALGPPDAVVIIYSVIDKASFERAESELSRLHVQDMLRNRCIALVANKIDAVRSRVVKESDGISLACSYNAKFIEISVGMNHNCDDLLVGILHQIRLNECSSDQDLLNVKEAHSWTRSKSLVRASRKCKRALTKVFGREEARRKNVTNFHVHS